MKQCSALLLIALFVSLPICSVLAQRPAVKPAPTPAATDSTQLAPSATDSIPSVIQRNGIRVGNSILVDEDSTDLEVADTLRITATQEAKIHKIIPKRATLRSLVLPGLGQAYNRQYYKIPFIYVGFGVMGYLFVRYRKLASQAAIGYQRLLYGDSVTPTNYADLDSNIYPGSLTTPIYVTPVIPESVVIGDYQVYSSTNAKAYYDLYRRYRDLNILLSVALWGINIVEANVAAHLKTFDLSDDISMRVEPNAIPLLGAGFAPGVRVAFTFK